MDLPTRVNHGDLKISNLHFNGDDTGLCLLDLDTIGPGDYSIEMGDAWRHGAILQENPTQKPHDSTSLLERSFNGWRSTVERYQARNRLLWYPESIEYV